MQQEVIHQDLRTKSIRKLFVSYLVPAVLGMVLMSINIIIDGIMVSRGVGQLGLAGVNVASPVFPIIFAISLWIGMGGATLYSIALGENKIERARHIFTQSITLAVVVVGILMVVCLWNIEGLAYLFGANEVILPYTLEYLKVLLMFGVIYVLENVLSIFIRNDGNPRLAMTGLIITAILNIIFNYVFIFIFHWGVRGSALGTILSAAIGFLVLLTHFFKKDSLLKWTKLRFDWAIVKDIMTIGFPSFVTEMSVAIVTVGYNVAFIKHAGEIGVAGFAIVNNIHTMALLVFFGVGAALQPIVSYHFGAELFDRMKAALRLAVKTAVVCGIIAVVLGFICAKYIVMLFDIQSQQLLDFTVKGIGLFFIQYIFLGFNIVYAEYFQSIRQTKRSTFIILSRGLLLVFPLLWILPNFLGVNGIWLVPVTAEALTMIMILVMNRRKDPLLVTRKA
ncbi:MATE family efflux transporter [Paenibacillus sp. KN14-4R]|uniref:MATE family efflux transporter n=1 Tax=Paenibacillus sp. KN14-4R TaxID=3445773 RepID=UPI003FA0243A